MLKLIFKALWKVITYLVAAAILGVIISAFFSPVAGVIVAAIGVLGMIPAIKDEMMKEDIPKYREERKRKKLMKDDGKSFGMRRDIDVENMGFDKQKQRSRVALGHTVAAVFPMRPSFSVGSTEEEVKGLPVQLVSQPSLQRTEHPPAEALPRQSVQLHHAGLDALLQTDAFIQVAGVSAVISRAVFATHIVGTVAKAAADASASARLMTGWRHHLHLCGEQGCELHKVSRQIIPLLSGNKKRPESYC